MTLVAGLGVFMAGMSSWYRGQDKMDVEGTAHRAVRMMSLELREAMVVQVASNGKSVTYQRPATTSSGNYKVPLVWDGIDRKIEFDKDKVNLLAGGKIVRTLCRGVLGNDPAENGNPAYKMFTPGEGTLTRSVTIQVVTGRDKGKSKYVSSRRRETVYVRNVPELIR